MPSIFNPATPLDLQIQVQGTSLFNMSVEDQARYIEALVDSLRSQRIFLKEEADKLQDGIHDLQGQLEQAKGERIRLEQERDLANEAYQSLARKSQEVRLVAQDQETVARVASQAAVPTEKVSPRIMLNTALVGVLGFIFSSIAIILFEWWRAD